MKFKVSWAIDQDKWLPVLEMFSSMTPEHRADAGDGVKILGRWHDMGARTGVAILEADDLVALSAYMALWNPHMDLDVAPVLDDDEVAALGTKIVAAQQA